MAILVLSLLSFAVLSYYARSCLTTHKHFKYKFVTQSLDYRLDHQIMTAFLSTPFFLIISLVFWAQPQWLLTIVPKSLFTVILNFQSIGPLGRCFLWVEMSICLCVSVSVHFLRYRLVVFLHPLPEGGCPIFL